MREPLSSSLQKYSTYRALKNGGARLLSSTVINKDFGYANWLNQGSQIKYSQVKSNTLSLYLNGGYGISRTDTKTRFGYQGAIYLLPEGSDSSWQVNGMVNLCHFYFSNDAIRRFAIKTLDIEPASIQIPELTFSSNLILKNATYQFFMSIENESHIKKEMAINNILYQLLSILTIRKTTIKHTGGLSPSINRRLKEYIDENFTTTITLEILSNYIDLSTFHLQRMFKFTNGISPHDYLMERRIEKVKSQLGKVSLAQLALDCGFNHQSHMHRVFKNYVGISPLQYLKEPLVKS